MEKYRKFKNSITTVWFNYNKNYSNMDKLDRLIYLAAALSEVYYNYNEDN